MSKVDVFSLDRVREIDCGIDNSQCLLSIDIVTLSWCTAPSIGLGAIDLLSSSREDEQREGGYRELHLEMVEPKFPKTELICIENVLIVSKRAVAILCSR